MTDKSELTTRDADGVRWIVIFRPESKNGLTTELNERIIRELDQAGEDSSVRVVAIFGAGGVFSSGLDLKAAAALGQVGPEETEKRMRAYFHGLIRAVRRCPKPVVAVVDGAAAGYGCDLALACDLRFCSDRARFGEIFVRRGLMPDGGGTFFLPRLVGLGRAMELMLFGDMLEAEEAKTLGLANQVAPSSEIEARAQEYCARLARGAPLVHRAVKEYVYRSLGDLDQALENEVRGQMRLLQSKDFMEGVMAFLQKREPTFQGE